MKTLLVIRHAKSSWEDSSLDDFDRPLNDRGKRDAPEMGYRLKRKGLVPDLMISSPAKRTFSTCKKIAKVLGYQKHLILQDNKLYHAGSDTLLAVVKSFSDDLNTVFLFGHNPGLTDFVNHVAIKLTLDNLPTCGVVALRFNTPSWARVEAGLGTVDYYDYPKKEN